MSFPAPIARRSALARAIYATLLPLSLAVWLLPLAAVALTSIRPSADIMAGNYWGPPSQVNPWENYVTVFRDSTLGRNLWNSIWITLPTVVGTLALSSLAAFALAMHRFGGNLTIFFLFIAGNFIPFQILMVPVRDLTVRMGLYDTTTGLVLFHIAFQTGFCTLFLRNFLKQLPMELIEAARVEGVSELRIFCYIVMPLMRPALGALAVLVFTFIWNDYFWATVLTQSAAAMPVTAGINSLSGLYVTQWNLVSAGSIIAALPPVLLFFALQRQFVAGLTLGAVK